MSDTNPEIETIFTKMMMAKTGDERMMMGFSMFDTAKAIVIASLHEKNPTISGALLKKELFLRFYGNDFSEAEPVKIIAALK